MIFVLFFATAFPGLALRINPENGKPELAATTENAMPELAKTKENAAPELAATMESFGCFYDELYKQAAQQEGKKQEMPQSPYLVVWPRSFVERFQKLHTNIVSKSHKFNFIGDVNSKDIKQRVRTWVQEFVKEHFKEENGDYFVNTHTNVASMGSIDHSDTWKSQSVNNCAKLPEQGGVPFDENYMTTLVESEFTLSPRGDRPYSYRFCEALFAKSIPIVEKREDANCEIRPPNKGPKISQRNEYHFYVRNPDPNFEYVYNKTWAEENFAKAMKYHTLMDQ